MTETVCADELTQGDVILWCGDPCSVLEVSRQHQRSSIKCTTDERYVYLRRHCVGAAPVVVNYDRFETIERVVP